MKILNQYLALQQEIYNYFGFVENWVALPLDDRREFYWKIEDDSEVVFSCDKDMERNRMDCFSDEIYKQRFYKKWVYRGEDYTMIMVDTHTDGNRFLAIYDNSKEIN